MKSGFVAVAGRPNVGKSTLVNALAGTKVAIVSDKPHTTRNRIRGVHTTADAQLILVDLPGWQRPIDPLTERMQGTVDDAMSSDDVDAILLVVSARDRIGAGDKFVARKVFSLGLPVVIVVNKIDRLKHGHVATQMKEAARLGDFHALHPVQRADRRRHRRSARRPDLAAARRADVLPGGTDTDMPLEARIAELVREQALILTKEEVPHAVTAEVVELDDKLVHVRVYTETESQKQILIGKGGTMVREIGRQARPGIEQLIGHQIHLQLQVKASPKWRRNQTMLERLGL